jgi:hypothetical protein
MDEQLKSTEIVASYSGKISTGRYENESPFFSIKEEWTNADKEFIISRQKLLNQLCYDRFTECANRSLVDRLKEQYHHLRFYMFNGIQLPSVTSIIGWDKDFFMAPEELAQYAARGTIIHKQVEIFLKTDKLIPPEEIPEVFPQYVTMTKGSLKLTLDGFNFVSFFEKNPIELIDTEKQVVNLDKKYSGRMDIKAKFNGKVSIMDVKTGTVDETECFKQLAAYAKGSGNSDVSQLVIIPINNKTKQGFSEPKVTSDIEKYFSLFLEDRKKFEERFGL